MSILLVYASRAAGIPLEKYGDIENGDLYIDDRGTWWNPLEDDGDAFRLATALMLNIEYSGTWVFVSPVDDREAVAERFDEDRNEITRLAIVKAAAITELNKYA